ncbi:MAG: type II secretion system protein [Planctomycetales bacterium]|nr:type II secretion system protein [Planctomycetales bacterium]
MRNARDAYCHVDFLIAVVIIGIMLASMLPAFTTNVTEARESALRANLSSLRGAIEDYRLRSDVFPTSLADLQSAVGTIPRNPYTNASGIRFVLDPAEVVADESARVSVQNGQKAGWFYHPRSGRIWANCEGTASGGQWLISL